MNTPLEPIFLEDILAEQDYATYGWKVMYDFYQRVVAQGAPPELIQQVIQMNTTYQTLVTQIAAVKPWFKPEKY